MSRFTWRRRAKAVAASTAAPPAGDTWPALPAEPRTPSLPELARLMGRAEVMVLTARSRHLIAQRRVLVTGACGTIGSALCRQIARFEPAALCLLDDDAVRLRALYEELRALHEDLRPPRRGRRPAGRLSIAHVDVRDRAWVDRLFGELRPDLVFHTAGLRGVTTLEGEPCRGVAVNVLGTSHVVGASIRHEVDRMVFVSSDKAADPASVFGATKRLGELVVQHAAGAATRFAAVRIGDVIGSPGPLLPALAGLLRRNETIVVAHPQVARHFMTVAEAAGLVLEAASLAEQAETFALDTGRPVPMVDLVHRYAEQLRTREVTIRFSGLPSGEKLTEKVFSDSEQRVATVHPKVWATCHAPPPADLPRLLDLLFLAAERGDDEEVLTLLRRLLPEYRPLRRPQPSDGGSP